MKTAADIVAAAIAAQKAKEGVRLPVRFASSLIARARECAADVDEPLGDWVNKACRAWSAGKFGPVANTGKSDLATHEKSEVVTVRAPAGMKASDIKSAVLSCCVYCESKRIVYTPDKAPERYFLEVSE